MKNIPLKLKVNDMNSLKEYADRRLKPYQPLHKESEFLEIHENNNKKFYITNFFIKYQMILNHVQLQ